MYGEKKEERKPAANAYIEITNDVVLFLRESTMFDIRSQIIQPSQSATFSTSLQPFIFQPQNKYNFFRTLERFKLLRKREIFIIIYIYQFFEEEQSNCLQFHALQYKL